MKHVMTGNGMVELKKARWSVAPRGKSGPRMDLFLIGLIKKMAKPDDV